VRRTPLHRPAPRVVEDPPAATGDRDLTPAEQAVVRRLVEVVPGGAGGLADQLDGIRVRDAVGWVDGRPAHSVVALEHWGRWSAVTLPVRGFSVDAAGAPVGEIVVWAHEGRLVGFRHQAVVADRLPPALQPDTVDAVPRPA